MLMAFQAQIDRAEDTVRDLEARLESRREMLQQVEERLAALAGRLEGLLERAEGAEVNLAAMVRRARPEPDGPALLITLPESVTSSDETAV
jgi:septal ring factor EnvC (AmiA/AmiB activator)